jgi:hypothetical protein
VSVPEVMKVCEVVPVPEVIKVMKVSKVSEAVSWKVRAMTERMYAPRSAAHAKAVHTAEAVHATKTVHRVGGQRHWRGQHRHRNSTSDCYFAEHDNPPDCHKLPPRHTVRPQC